MVRAGAATRGDRLGRPVHHWCSAGPPGHREPPPASPFGCADPTRLSPTRLPAALRSPLQEERYASIERENRLLLEKMSSIMRRRSGEFGNAPASSAAESAARGGGASLNHGRRRRQLQRIARENQQLLHRIQNAQPYYDHAEWLEEARRNQQYMRNICEFKVDG